VVVVVVAVVLVAAVVVVSAAKAWLFTPKIKAMAADKVAIFFMTKFL
jgi:Flp pilus assembly pilin Flp